MDLKEIKKNELLLNDSKIMLSNTYERVEVKRLTNQIKKLEFSQDSLIMTFLEESDEHFRGIIEDNLSILANDNIEFTAINEAGELFSSHANRFIGEVSATGHLSCKTMEYDTAYFFFQKGFYPVHYTGLINHLGEIAFWVDKKAFSLFRHKIPIKFVGSIDKKGNVNMEVREFAPIISSSISIDRIEADLFSGDKQKREKFLENKVKIKNLISAFRQNLIASHSVAEEIKPDSV